MSTIGLALRDASGNLQSIISEQYAGALSTHSTPDINGAAGFTSANPGSVKVVNTPGTSGSDFSVNSPQIPELGAGFPGSGLYPNFVLVTTIPANATRMNVDIENSSGGPIVILRDDGTAATGQTLNNASMFPLAGGLTPGAQGGSWSSTTFKGRIQIFAPASNVFITAMVD
jgi:hypothetical protein